MTAPTTRPCPTCGEAFPLSELFCPNDGSPLTPPAVPLIGRTVDGRYQVIKELGRGGMGQVFLATQLPMKRPCALKVIRPDRGWDPGSVARFHREAENASRISHANVAQVYDSGEADGVAYLAMEYVDGEPLSAVLNREGRLSPRRTARIVWQVANALGAAHHLGIVHRDLKPDNVMLTRYRDRVDFVKVVDFGIAKAPGAEGQQVTSASVVVGTPDYMSPEQFLGTDIDGRSDVYALAILTIRMLTGVMPPVVGLKALQQQPGTADPAGLKQMPETKDWPEPVFAVLSRALARLAKDRTPSVDEFFQQFAIVVSRWEPATGAPEAWETGVAPSKPARPRWPWIGVGAAAAVVIAVTVVRNWPSGDGGSPAPLPAPVPVPPPPNPDTTIEESFAAADSVARLERLTDPGSATVASAREGIALYQRLEPRIDGALRGEAAYYAGRGLVRLRQEREACRLFALAANDTKGTRLAEPVAALLAGCPRR